jgi:transposase-like protein
MIIVGQIGLGVPAGMGRGLPRPCDPEWRDHDRLGHAMLVSLNESVAIIRGLEEHDLTYGTVRYWRRKFGQTYANQLRRRRPRPGDKWHLDEVFLTIHGERHYLWRAIDQDGNILDILVQRRRDKQAAKRFFRKLLKGLTYVPRVMITDRLKSYGAALRESLPSVEHRQHRYLNNRAENSH